LTIFTVTRYRDFKSKPSDSNSTNSEHGTVIERPNGGTLTIFLEIIVLILIGGVTIYGAFNFLRHPHPPLPPETTSPTIITKSSESDILGWEEIINSEPGDTIFFGKYRQSEWTDDKENISWIVLAKESDRLLILTTKCIDCKQFHDVDETCTWETSSIRRWLNNDFLEDAFNGPEKSKILTVNVPADGNPHYDTVFLGDATEDKIFLLSIIEAEKYLGSNEKLMAFPTEYAKSIGSGIDHDLIGNPCWWWLRTPGQNNKCIADIRSGGAINYEGYVATSTTFSVRPALWLDINS